MHNKINNVGYILLIFIILLFSIIFSFTISAVDDEGDNSDQSYDVDDQYIIIDIPVEKDIDILMDYPVEKNNVISIRYPNANIRVIPPSGSEIVGVENNSVKLLINKKTDYIYYNDTISKFGPVNFKSSVKGTDDFELDVYCNYDYYIGNNNDYPFECYIIEWGNGDVTSGNGTIPSIVSYSYDKQGVYPLNISLIDSKGITYVYHRNQTYRLSTDQYVKIWTIENKETVAAGSAGTISILTLIGVALTETGKYKLLALLLLFFPMFTKIQKEDVLDHFVRGQIYGYIKAYPGAHYNQIMRELDIKNGTLSYHLYILEKTGTIKSRKEGFRYRAFYPTEIKFPEEERYRLTELQINIIKIIQENKGINQKNIAKKLNENHQTISYNIKVLSQAGIINTSRKGRKNYCSVNQNLSDKLPI